MPNKKPLIRTRSVHFHDTEPTLAQVLSSGAEFAMVTEDNHQCTPFVLCRDFLQDTIQSTLNKRKLSLYGFVHDPDPKKSHQPSLRKTKLLMAHSTRKMNVPNMLDLLNQIETDLKIAKTKIYKCKGDIPKRYMRGGVFLIIGSCRWIKSPVMISLYTLLLRIGSSHKAGTPYVETIESIAAGTKRPPQALDKSRIKAAKNGIETILKLGDRKIFGHNIASNYPADINLNTMHHIMGIIGFSNKQTAKHMPKWHEV